MNRTSGLDRVAPKTTTMQMGEDTDGRDVTVLNFTYVRAALIVLYSFVFLICFLGNLAVLVVTRYRKRMGNSKSFILGHLAGANLCVALFCIYQSLYTFYINRWNQGPFLCKMFHFASSLSHAASVLILVITTIERYVVITEPIRNRSILTMRRKRLAIVTAWILSALVSFHKFYYVTLIRHHLGPSQVEVICTIDVSLFNYKMADMLSFVFLFVLPLVVICLLHIRIAVFLQEQRSAWPPPIEFELESFNRINNKTLQQQQLSSGRDIRSHSHHLLCALTVVPAVLACSLQARDKANHRITKILSIVALCFVLSNFPFHLRKMLQNYTDYYSENPWMELVAPLTFLIMYANSAVSPFVFALLSKDFKNSLMEVVMRCRKRYLGPSAAVV